MKVEKLIIFVIFLGLIQLAACERSKITDPGPNSVREAADSLNPYKPDTLVGGTDSLPNADSVRRQLGWLCYQLAI